MAHQECLPGLAQTHERPRFAAVVTLPQAAPGGGVAPDARRAHADVDHARPGIGHIDIADGPAEILVGDVIPVLSNKPFLFVRLFVNPLRY